MGLFDKLMQVDDAKLREKKSVKVKSERLTELLGVDTYITLEELPYRQVKNMVDAAMKNNGRQDPNRGVDQECHMIRLSCKDINFGNEELQKKFNASDPKDLVEKMFGRDVPKLAGEILDISGFSNDDDEDEAETIEEVKN